MERLTSRNKGRSREMICRYEECCTCEECCPLLSENDCRCLQEVAKKLAEYEDLEEQGLLLKLPCKVGDKLYIVNPRNEILELTVKEFIYRAYRIPRLEIYFEDGSGFETCLFDGTLNETVFLTQAEAEEALM